MKTQKPLPRQMRSYLSRPEYAGALGRFIMGHPQPKQPAHTNIRTLIDDIDAEFKKDGVSEVSPVLWKVEFRKDGRPFSATTLESLKYERGGVSFTMQQNLGGIPIQDMEADRLSWREKNKTPHPKRRKNRHRPQKTGGDALKLQ